MAKGGAWAPSAPPPVCAFAYRYVFTLSVLLMVKLVFKLEPWY